MREGLLNSAIWLNNPSLADASHRNGILSMSHLALSLPGMRLALAPEAIRRAAIDSERRSPALNHWRNILRDLPRTAAFVPHYLHKRYLRPRKLPAFFLFNPGNRYCLYYQGEQAPDPNSRVTLGEQRDALGMRRLVIEFRYSAADIESVLRTHQLLGAHLGRLGLGELHFLAADPRAAIDRQATDGIHQIGTTRMSQRPEDGVVDAHCRVHSTTNLFVASSSVFPTSGQANPTLPIVAMAVRVAETINAELNGRRLYQQAVSRIIAPAANRPAQPQPAISAPS